MDITICDLIAKGKVVNAEILFKALGGGEGKEGYSMKRVKSHWNYRIRYNSDTLNALVEKANYRNINEDTPIQLRSSGNYLPTREDYESAYRMLCSPGQPIENDSILDQVEKNAINSGHNLKEQWRLITGKNIEIWVKGI